MVFLGLTSPTLRGKTKEIGMTVQGEGLLREDSPEAKAIIARLDTLEKLFLHYTREERSDENAWPFVPLIMREVDELEEIRNPAGGHGFGHGFKAIELLEKLPSVKDILMARQLPETHYWLWRHLAAEMMRGSAHTPDFAKALLKKKVLGSQEQVRLKDALKDVFERCDSVEVRQSLFWAMRQITQRSEPIVARAFLRTVVQKGEDKYLVEMMLGWKK